MISNFVGVFLGAVMCFAGGAKIAMGQRWPVEARSMRSPAWAIPILPWAEIAIGALLIARVQTTLIGVAALGLILSFTGLILVNLLAGHRPVCTCFGIWRATPLGWSHIVRNATLSALAVISILG